MTTELIVEIQGLYLFKSLVKDGCKWHGDVMGKWSECLYFEDDQRHQVMQTLEAYREGIDYRLEGNSVWIA